MKFGVFSLMEWPEDRSQSDAFRAELDQLTLAEQQGYDSIWLAEPHFSRCGIGPAIHLTAAHLAARTTRVRIGTAVTIVPFLHPLRIAEEIAVLDIMSNGRIDWCAGQGYPGHEFAGSGEDIHRSHDVFREQLEIILRAWSGESFSFDGEFFQFPELQCLPTPVQDPHPPVWIAALSPSAIEWAGAQGHRVLTDPFSPVSRIEENRKLYCEHLSQSGVKRGDREISTLRHVYVGDTMSKAREEAAPALLRYYRSLACEGSPRIGGPLPENHSFYSVFAEGGSLDPDLDPDGFLEFLFEECTIVGDEAYCRDKLAELRERIDLDYLIAWQNFGGLPPEASMASQRRFIEKVAPSLR